MTAAAATSKESRFAARDIRIDLGRCLAALAVVYVHYTVGLLPYDNGKNIPAWLMANVAHSIGFTAVPLFIMMSGAMIIGKPIASWSDYMKTRMLAVFKPYLFGTVFFHVFEKLVHHTPFDPFRQSLLLVLSGNGFGPLYFLFILAGMYLITPLLQGINTVPKSTVTATTGILFALVGGESLLNIFGLSIGYLGLGLCYCYLPYFLAGYLIYNGRRFPTRLLLAAFIGCIAVTAILPLLFKEETCSYLRQYQSFIVIVQSLSAFCLLQQVEIRSARVKDWIYRIADLTLGIYILHIIVLQEMLAWLDGFLPLPPFCKILLYPAIIFAVTAALVRLLRIIPKAKGFV